VAGYLDILDRVGGLLQEPGLNRGCVSSQTILIVDDEAPLRQILRARLTARGPCR
jgi:hypothetical protein